MIEELRSWLKEKHDRGVKDVRVSTVLGEVDRLAEEERLARRSPKPGANGKVTITADDLLGASEVADLLRVDRTRPSKWRNKGTRFGPEASLFPEPFRDLLTGPVWLRSQIEPLIPLVEARRRQRHAE